MHFYETDAVFCDSLSAFVGAALGAGGACIVVATPIHQKELLHRLESYGIDVQKCAAEHRYTALDAEDTLSRILINGEADPSLFASMIEPFLTRAKASVGRRSCPIVVFGEMVALLWTQGMRDAAIKLEHLWNGLVRKHNFALRCAYPVGNLRHEPQADLLHRITAVHSEVITTGDESSAEQIAERLRITSSLRNQASITETVPEERVRVILQRKKMEERLQRSEEFAKNIVESTVDCVKVLDCDGKIEYISPPGLRTLEITDEREYLGRPWVTFWLKEDRKRAEDAISSARSGGVGSFQGETIGPSGVKKCWDVKITPALDTRGAIESLVVVSRDITELRAAQEIAIQAEKLAAAGRLAATIAHEINNPLEAVTNFIYLAMTAEGLPEQVFRHLQIADRELARVAQIAQQTLGFYRDNAKGRWIDVNELMQGVTVLYERKLARKHLRIEIASTKELKVYGKQGELRQALSNLIANAIDASNDGGNIWLRAHATRNWTNGMKPGVRITLADNGSGMTPEVQRRIFVPFFTTKADIGTGIGLWTTKNLIEKQGGHMRFRSKQGEKAGTVMSFFLPSDQSGPEEMSKAVA